MFKSKLDRILIFLLMIELMTLGVYLIPTRCKNTYVLYTLDGEAVEAVLDVKVVRHIFTCYEILGTIYLDGEEYISAKDHFRDYEKQEGSDLFVTRNYTMYDSEWSYLILGVSNISLDGINITTNKGYFLINGTPKGE